MNIMMYRKLYYFLLQVTFCCGNPYHTYKLIKNHSVLKSRVECATAPYIAKISVHLKWIIGTTLSH